MIDELFTAFGSRPHSKVEVFESHPSRKVRSMEELALETGSVSMVSSVEAFGLCGRAK